MLTIQNTIQFTMPLTANNQFKPFLKGATKMKLGTDRAVTRVLHERITTTLSFEDFDRSSLKALAKNCEEMNKLQLNLSMDKLNHRVRQTKMKVDAAISKAKSEEDATISKTKRER